jgi:hypothetical protein
MRNSPQALRKMSRSPGGAFREFGRISRDDVDAPLGTGVALHAVVDMHPCFAASRRKDMPTVVSASPDEVRRNRDAFDRMVRIIRAEFTEMPGMHLTRTQFGRLWHLGDADRDQLLRHLIGSGFLVESGDGISRPPDY